MKALVCILACLASSCALAETGLPQMLGDAYACSDASLKTYALDTCEPPAVIAAMAAAKCEPQWAAIADRAVGAQTGRAADRKRTPAAAQYLKSIEAEYEHIAELKVIDIRTDERRCGFD